MSSQWFAAYTRTRHEKKVQEHARLRDMDTLLPLYHSVHRWQNGVRKEISLPLFPNYVFIRFPVNNRVMVLHIPGVLDIIGTSSNLTAIPDQQIEQIRSMMSGVKIKPHPFIKIGDPVRIKFGALKGMEGVIVRVKGGWRLVISVNLIMRSVAIEIDAADLEPLPTYIRPTTRTEHVVF